MNDLPDTDKSGQKLPRRDWLILPLLSLFTIVFLFIALRSLGNHLFSAFGNLEDHCLTFHDALHGAHGIPNTVCSVKFAESVPHEYRFNSCGHRTNLECAQKSPGAFRIVTIGSSYVFGQSVAPEQSFPGLLPADLSLKTGRNIEVYNEGVDYNFTHNIDLNFDDILAAKPDLILWAITPIDVKAAAQTIQLKPPKYTVPGLVDPGPNSSYFARVKYNVQLTFAGKSFLAGLHAFWDLEATQFDAGSISLMFRHYLYLSQSQYIKAYLLGGQGDRDTMFLQTNPSPEWQAKLKQYDIYVASIAAKSKAAGIPLVATMIPQRGQSAMLSMGTWPNDVDPNKLNNELRAMVTAHGGIYIDLLPGISKIPNPEQYFLPIDGHPIPAGHAIIANLMASELTSGAVPSLNATPQEQEK